jgi:hypothetical protein
LKAATKKGRIRIRHPVYGIRGSGSVSKCYGGAQHSFFYVPLFHPPGSYFQQVKNGELEETAVLKGKGKGKGKGKSNLVHAKPTEEEQEVAAVKEGEKEKKNRKSATEIYHSLLKSSPESGDEESEEDSEDEEFGGGEFRAQDTWATNFFSPLSFVAVFGSGIRDPGSGMSKNQDPGSGINIPDPPHWCT